MNFFRLSFIIISLSCFSCTDVIPEFACYHFDQRQCQTDEFGPDIAAADQSEWVDIMRSYLESKEIIVDDIKVNFQHYEAVCEACDICPEIHRFYVKISVLNTANIEVLNLLNIELDNCGEYF